MANGRAGTQAIHVINAGAATVVVIAAIALAADLPSVRSSSLRPTATVVAETHPTATGNLVDASGAAVPLGPYRRIGSGSLVADRLLLMLCEPDRIVAFSESAATAYQAYRFSGKPALPSMNSIEAIAAHNLDLLIVNNMAQQPHLHRLRESGVVVFDLGAMHGVSTLLPNIEAIGVLLGHPERAAALKQDFEHRMAHIAQAVPPTQRRTAIYVGVHGDKMYGGTLGSSFHDILNAAGLVDAAASTYTGWPRYTSEQMLMLDPDVIVTQLGMRQTLCGNFGMQQLKACQGDDNIVQMDPALLLDPGLPMAEAAAHIHHVVYESTQR